MNIAQARRIHITGASGAGVTSLGRALADRLAAPHHDTDDYFWVPTTPPYRQKRKLDDRLRLIRELFLDRPDWILTGSLDGWGDPIIPFFDLVVFVYTAADVRLQRLHDRETRRHGADAIGPGGQWHLEFEEFVTWASGYDDNQFDGRNLARHQAWLSKLPCRVIRVDGVRPLDVLAAEVLAATTK